VRIKIEAFSLDSTSIKVHPDGTGALKKRTTCHRQIPRRMEHQDSYGCRGCSYGRDLLALTRPSARCARGPRIAAPLGRTQSAAALAHGSRLRGQRDAATRTRPGLHSRRPAAQDTHRALGIRPRHVQAKRSWTTVPEPQGYRRIFSRFEKLDVMFIGFISFVLIADGLRLC
jgi:hypothetical protein